MSEARLRIDSLVVEGFKAFGAPQEIQVAARHCFLFGANALGKSSIVQAIRWCLFGSERDSDVRNRFGESADCRVELRLRDGTGLWSLERRLRPGQLRSDLTVRDPGSKEVTLKEALPNLVRLGTSAGPVVFFSAQQGARARAYSDLSRFHEVLYAHLDLGEAERLRRELGELLEEQLVIQQRRAEELQSAEDGLRERFQKVSADLDEVLRSPPWELEEPPTRAVSEKRVRSLVADLATETGYSVDSAWECSEILDNAQAWVHDLTEERSTECDQAAASIEEQARQLSMRLESIHETEKREETGVAAMGELTQRIVELCEGASLDELESRMEVASARLSKEAQFARARKAVAPLLGPDIRECPICGLTCDGAHLLDRMTEDIEQSHAAHEQAAEEVQTLEHRTEEVRCLVASRDAASEEAENARREGEQLATQMAKELGCSLDAWKRSAEAHLAELEGRLVDLQQEGRSAAEHSARRRQQIRALREEWEYHQLRDEEQRLRRELEESLQPARDRLRAFEDFRSVVVDLHEALREEFDAAVDRALPTVSAQLTEAFCRLTDHPAFDELHVQRAQGTDQLEVLVGSTLAPVPLSRPEDVLNGGAYAALGLIPHFVFSSFHAEQVELNVLIIDDPSQSFDTTHVELLLEELQRAGKHAQLLLATHEEERFRPVVERLFPRDSLTLVRVTDFRPDRGPTIEYG